MHIAKHYLSTVLQLFEAIISAVFNDCGFFSACPSFPIHTTFKAAKSNSSQIKYRFQKEAHCQSELLLFF